MIPTQNIQNFLESVLPIFTKVFQEQTGIGDAIEWYLESTGSNIIESRFIHACIAIELLNDRFKKNNKQDEIFPDSQFEILKKVIKSKLLKLSLDEDKLKELRLKLPELNRPTQKSSLKKIYGTYKISYSDLFPEFEFVKIRNNIVHTGLSRDEIVTTDIPEAEFIDLIETYKKLIALLQRTLLGMLDYNGEFKDILYNWKLKEFKKKID